MTHKAFYQAAAAEVAQGHLDTALWIKVNAEMPGSDEATKQARYIALRAAEMSRESAAHTLRGWMPHSFWTWVGYVVLVIIVATILEAITVAIGGLGRTIVPVLVWMVFVIGAITFAANAAHSRRSASDTHREA